MRFLHTADLHLGRRMNDIPLIDDQRSILEQITRIAREEKVDAVLIAGDVYDKASPSGEAMSLFDGFVTGLVEAGIKVAVISGNHDSEARITYLGGLIRSAGVWAEEPFEGRLTTYRTEDEHGELFIHLLPFTKPANVRRFLPEADTETYESAVKAVIENSPVDFSKRNVLICHQFIVGAQVSGDEQQAVGGLDSISSAVFDGFDYVALGHIHGAQHIARETLRYSGSPLKYSLSETAQKKSVTIVDMGPKGQVELRTVALELPHDVRDVEGMLADVLAMPWSDDYVRVTLNDEEPPPDARVSVLTVFPNMIKFGISNSKTRMDIDILGAERAEDKSFEELFRDFYALQMGGAEPSEDQLSLLRKLIEDQQGG